MRKFHDIYKEKQNISENLQESKVLTDFRKIYNTLLEHYNLTNIHQLDEKNQVAFLSELNQYWTEENGLNDKGQTFLKKRSSILTENSTPLQKKNYLKSRVYHLLNETLRQTEVKYKLYDIIEEMYTQVKAKEINDVLSPNMISNTLFEALATSLDEFVNSINNEIKDSLKKEVINEEVKPKKVFIKKKKS